MESRIAPPANQHSGERRVASWFDTGSRPRRGQLYKRRMDQGRSCLLRSLDVRAERLRSARAASRANSNTAWPILGCRVMTVELVPLLVTHGLRPPEPPKVEGALRDVRREGAKRRAIPLFSSCLPQLPVWHGACSLFFRHQMNDVERR